MSKPILIQLREAGATAQDLQDQIIRAAARKYDVTETLLALDKAVADFKRIALEATTPEGN